MNLNNMMGIAQKMGMDKGKINEVLKMANEYGVLQNGEVIGSKDILETVIKKNGGTSKIDEALNAYNKPIVKIGVNKLLQVMGISNPENVIKGAAEEVKILVGETPINSTKENNAMPVVQQDSKVNNLLNRLAKFK